MDYQPTANGFISERCIGDYRIAYEATNLRRADTGIHARLSIAIDQVVLAWSTFNVERDEDRVRLTNSAFKHLGPEPPIAQQQLKHDLDMFCQGLWEEKIRSLMPQLCQGTVPEPVRFLLEPFVMADGSTICFAPPGRGKSYTLLLMAVSIDANRTDLWHVEPAPVLVINLERSARTYLNRLGCVNRALGLPPERPLRILNARGYSLQDVLDAAARSVHEEGIKCVFVDSISRAGFGDLNENAPVNRIADGLNRLCPSWFALAHTPRSDEDHVYGSVHFDAAADMMLRLQGAQERLDGPMGVSLQITKANDIGRRPLSIFRMDFNEAGLYAVRDALTGEFPTLEQGELKPLSERLRGYAATHERFTASQAAEDLDARRATIFDYLQDPNLYRRLDKDGKSQFYGPASDNWN